MTRHRILILLAIALIAALWVLSQRSDAAAEVKADKIIAAKAEFRQRITAGLPGYEQDGVLHSPIAAGDQAK